MDRVQAQAQLDGVAAQLAAAFPETNRGTLARPDQPRPFSVVRHTRLHPNFRGEVGMIAAVLLTAVALVLLMACTNVAGLLLSRATARHREIAVRHALGAGRGRLFRQMLTESVLLGMAGGALGLIVTLWTADVLPSFFPPEQARMLGASIDWRVLAFTAAAAVISGLVFGVAPAFHGLKAVPSEALRAGSQRTGDARGGVRARKVLVGAQVALASVLLVSALLLTRSLSNALDDDPGFTTGQAVLSTIELPRSMTVDAARPYFDTVLERVRAVPGVEAAGFAQFVPIAGLSRRGFTMEGYVPREGEDTEFHFNTVTPEYFETMGIRAIRGRLFEDADRSGRLVAVVNHTLAERYFGGDAVGRQLVDSGGRQLEIIGVVGANRRFDLQDPPAPVVFYLLDHQFTARMMLVARTAGDAALLADTVRRTIAAVNPDAAVFRTVTLDAHLEEALAANRLTVALVVACGLMALTLALIGVYGVVAYSVARRRREIGVRVALGATRWQILRPLLTEHGTVVCLGLAVGIVAALSVTRLLGSMLYGISATHPGTYALVIAIVGAVAALASVLPASRALRVNPVAALRQD
jgi:putative ABC transport system permease protein